MLLAFLHGHKIDPKGLDNTFAFSAEEWGSRNGKGYSTRYVPFYGDFKSFSRRPSIAFCLLHMATHGYPGDGKNCLTSQPLK